MTIDFKKKHWDFKGEPNLKAKKNLLNWVLVVFQERRIPQRPIFIQFLMDKIRSHTIFVPHPVSLVNVLHYKC